MSLFRINPSFRPRLFQCRSLATALRNEEEYTSTPQYPPILDLSFKKKLQRKKEAVHEEIKGVKTIEEKQIKLNMPRYYGFKSYPLTENYSPYDNLTLAQHITKTHLIVNNNLPEFYKNIDVDKLVTEMKSEIEEAILIEFDGYLRTHDFKKEDLSKTQKEDIISSSVATKINRILMNKLATNHPHIGNAQVDYDPRIESTWYVGGMIPPEHIKSCRRGMEWMKPYENDPIDRVMVYFGSPSLTLRSTLPLQPIISQSEAQNTDLKVPFFKFDPVSVGNYTDHRHIANIPGFWPGDPHQFGMLSYHKRGYIFERERYQDAQDDKEALHRQGILASFGWLQAQANFLGFNTFNDITYPLVTQTIITSGKVWSFYTYQMNTIVLHSDNITENPTRNVCWATEEMNLFENIENDKIVGFNENVLSHLLKFYCNAPESRLGINLTPYLDNKEKCIADYAEDEKREWLEREYKYLVSNRPRFKPVYEIYSWEKIYKIDNKTRFMDKKLRPFELLQNPYKRRLDDRLANYIPRKLRPDLPRWKGRYAKEYFP
ncbi:mitochondrial ribosomal protein S30 [Leptinotarsa decemlineata]|uniref:mitochondrial ribosomal protein S30 n=1 Tax=Leptinotarsa decemlineata TaxID=7539 RepID=UPI000C2521CA|nr:28S ribosomal protein S30, mitochondrial [Leptinotarsa decemlineata]